MADRSRYLDFAGNTIICNGLRVAATKPGQLGTELTGTEIAYLDAVTPGTTSASKALVLDSNEELNWTYASSTVDNIEPLNLDTTLTGVGATGGRAKFTLTTNVALGSWSNALKAQVTYGSAGKTTGLGSALVAEMSLEAGCTDGSYAPLEVELGMPENAVTGTRTSFMSLNAYGHATGLGRLDDNGFLFDLNGLTASTDGTHVLNTGNTAPATVGGSLRVKIGSTTYYLILYTGPVTTT